MRIGARDRAMILGRFRFSSSSRLAHRQRAWERVHVGTEIECRRLLISGRVPFMKASSAFLCRFRTLPPSAARRCADDGHHSVLRGSAARNLTCGTAGGQLADSARASMVGRILRQRAHESRIPRNVRRGARRFLVEQDALRLTRVTARAVSLSVVWGLGSEVRRALQRTGRGQRPCPALVAKATVGRGLVVPW